MIIEFTAPPGSGKTYLSNLLTEKLREHFEPKGYKIITLQDLNQNKKSKIKNNFTSKAYNIFKFFSILDLSLFKAILAKVISEKSYKKRANSLRYSISILTHYTILQDLKNMDPNRVIFILEEGLLHLCVNLLPDGKSENGVKEYFMALEKNKKLKYSYEENINIFIDSALEENIQRINNRKQGWPSALKNLSKEKKYQALELAFEKHQLVKRELNMSKRSSIEIDNSTFKDEYGEFEKIIKEIELILMKR